MRFYDGENRMIYVFALPCVALLAFALPRIERRLRKRPAIRSDDEHARESIG
jgi:hypothetical protein